MTEELSEQVFDLLEQRIELKKMGRSGLSLWEILVLNSFNPDYAIGLERTRPKLKIINAEDDLPRLSLMALT